MIPCPNDRTINRILLEAPIEEVWRAVATPHGTMCYLTDRVETTGDPNWPAAGDKITLLYGDITNRAVIKEVMPLRSIVLADSYDSIAPDGTTDSFRVQTTYTFAEEGEWTSLTLEVLGFSDDTHGQWFRECLEMGWRRSLMNLKAVLELGMDLRTELFSYPRLGITNCTVNTRQSCETGIREGCGNYLLDVFPEGPADRANLRPGDVITAIGGVSVPDYRFFVREVSRYYGTSSPITVTYSREGHEYEAEVHVSIDLMFTGLIGGAVNAQELEQERRRRMAAERSASGAIWRTGR